MFSTHLFGDLKIMELLKSKFFINQFNKQEQEKIGNEAFEVLETFSIIKRQQLLEDVSENLSVNFIEDMEED